MSHYVEFSVDVEALLPARIRMPHILKAVVQYTGVSSMDIRAHRNQPVYVEARHLFCYCARRFTPNSYQTIGKFINRDHSTVVSAIAKFESRLTSDQELADEIDAIFALAQQIAHADRGMFLNDARGSA